MLLHMYVETSKTSVIFLADCAHETCLNVVCDSVLPEASSVIEGFTAIRDIANVRFVFMTSFLVFR